MIFKRLHDYAKPFVIFVGKMYISFYICGHFIFSIIKVRQAVLRQGKSLNNCIFVGDDLITAKHFGMFFDKEIVGIISVFENKNANFTSENQLQIRGMAILEQHQKKGYGKLLMLECENHATIKKASLIWFNARETAVGFYKNLDYSIIETPFIIENIGVHYIMYKYLQ